MTPGRLRLLRLATKELVTEDDIIMENMQQPNAGDHHAGPKAGASDDTIYTTDEVAAWLRLKPSTLEKARSTCLGNYPRYVRLGGRRIGYRHADVMSWLNANRCEVSGHRVKD